MTEGGGGLDIIDLSDPENPVGLPNYTGFGSAHTIRIDEATARCFINGSDLGAGGVRVRPAAESGRENFGPRNPSGSTQALQPVTEARGKPLEKRTSRQCQGTHREPPCAAAVRTAARMRV